MATLAAPRPEPVRMSRRVVEWGLLGVAILLLVVVFLRQARLVQDQAELAAVRTTLAAMRTAAVLQHIQASAGNSNSSIARAQQNPFAALQNPPPNYLGELDVQRLPEDMSGWFFDPACRCVGYVRAQTRWFPVSDGAQLLLFQVRRGSGPLQLFAMEDYLWRGELVR